MTFASNFGIRPLQIQRILHISCGVAAVWHGKCLASFQVIIGNRVQATSLRLRQELRRLDDGGD